MKRSLWFVGGIITVCLFVGGLSAARAEFFPLRVARSVPELFHDVFRGYVDIMRSLGVQQRNGTGAFVVPLKPMFARLDDVDTKLERIYQVCRGQGSGATIGSATLSQARSCIDGCVARTTAVPEGSSGHTRFFDETRFSACVSRCPANTLNGIACSYRYVDFLSGIHPADIRVECVRSGGSTPECERYVNIISDGLAACMVDQAAADCQNQCVRAWDTASFGDLAQCYGRCAGTAGFADASNALRRVNALDAHGDFDSSLAPTIPTGSSGSIPAIPSTVPPASFPPAPSFPPSPTPSSTLWECQSACDRAKITCIKTAPTSKALEMCDGEWNACYAACSK